MISSLRLPGLTYYDLPPLQQKILGTPRAEDVRDKAVNTETTALWKDPYDRRPLFADSSGA